MHRPAFRRRLLAMLSATICIVVQALASPGALAQPSHASEEPPVCGAERPACDAPAAGSAASVAERFAAASEERAIHQEIADGRLYLTIFYTHDCPHCADAMSFLAALDEGTGDCPECSAVVEALAQQRGAPKLVIRAYEIKKHPENRKLFGRFAEAYGTRPQGVPTVFLGEKFYVGFQRGVTCRLLADEIARLRGEGAACPAAKIDLPFLGEIDVRAVSLTRLAAIVGLLDGFNPCAMWVLMFLLGLLVHSGSRRRILLIGSVFVFASGAVYFAFMAAWLNLFIVIGLSSWITKVLALIAVTMGAINLKDVFWFKQGVSLMIPEGAKPTLYRRARAILHERRALGAVLGTLVLAVFVNFIELACTIGLPALFTKILAERQVPAVERYLLLLLYNLAYVAPLLIIVGVFGWTLGHFKLQDSHARLLKLVSGLLMLALGLLLLLKPELLIVS